MPNFDWLDGTYEDALRSVGERALTARQARAEKAAAVKAAEGEQGWMEWLQNMASQAGQGISGAAQKVWENDHARRALIGAGIGAAGGGLMSLTSKDRRKRLFGNVLTGGLLGGAIGGGGSLAYEYLGKGKLPGNEQPTIAGVPDKKDAVTQANRARQELGILGLPQERSKAPGVNRDDVFAMVDRAGTGLANLPDAIGAAGRNARFDQVAAQADVLGTKSLLPGYFDPLTAGTAVGANVAARLAGRYGKPLLGEQNRERLLQHQVGGLKASDPEVMELRKKLNDNLAGGGTIAQREGHLRNYYRANAGLARRLTGGWGPALAGLLPLVMHEWGPSGYRAGAPAYRELADAQARIGR